MLPTSIDLKPAQELAAAPTGAGKLTASVQNIHTDASRDLTVTSADPPQSTAIAQEEQLVFATPTASSALVGSDVGGHTSSMIDSILQFRPQRPPTKSEAFSFENWMASERSVFLASGKSAEVCYCSAEFHIDLMSAFPPSGQVAICDYKAYGTRPWSMP